MRFSTIKGQPCGGRILNYLLEESRLIKQARNERNFHVFYELLAGGEASMLEQELDLVRGCDTYALLNGGVAGGGEMPIDASDLEADRANFALMHDALATCDFTSADRLVCMSIHAIRFEATLRVLFNAYSSLEMK